MGSIIVTLNGYCDLPWGLNDLGGKNPLDKLREVWSFRNEQDIN